MKGPNLRTRVNGGTRLRLSEACAQAKVRRPRPGPAAQGLIRQSGMIRRNQVWLVLRLRSDSSLICYKETPASYLSSFICKMGMGTVPSYLPHHR